MTSSPDKRTASPTAEQKTPTRCTLCDLPTPRPPIRSKNVEGTFCYPGCRDVYKTLDNLDDEDAAAVRDRLQGKQRNTNRLPEQADESFLHVGGMHCAACEAFLETVAEQEEGVFKPRRAMRQR